MFSNLFYAFLFLIWCVQLFLVNYISLWLFGIFCAIATFELVTFYLLDPIYNDVSKEEEGAINEEC